ncbi:MAG: KTSC domain-containing protein [Candidatus Gracilibacteria bacterium]|nr:KTSC domain-containing protein [Candidatus Gracilibacteria bacterium]
MNLDRIEVFSHEISSVGYDENENILQIEFTDLCIYNYFEVPKNIYQHCICSDSIEIFFQAHIENYYESDRIL